MLIVMVPLGAVAALDAASFRARIGVMVFAVGLCSMLTVSVTYHRWVHTMRARAAWRRADHAMIFVAIAATSTPLCLAVGPASSVAWRLIVVWTIGMLGVATKVTGTRAGNHMGNALYMTNGWAGIFILPRLWAGGDTVATVLFITGGIVYTFGAIGFARRWPTLRPSVFGYHEVWHTATVIAATFHLVAVWMIAV